ncbi:response regulator transcription factor [Heliophilum fasciatum]|uniref:Stage 0 sporulation protein A homolog n=1 Tax=Heliophilum fasciatum TaxID=35700 RepID=A0A4R2RU68_9FIRM|nr:response regulator transcription factor [Heliophilum fasciatum]MCW2278623.1 DNA-binding response OmpR family regulator [Heliophilum fasciatum]TCP62675.1 transcriptional regulator [Heliophilum fasciatum]
MQVLIAEDDRRLGQLTVHMLQREGHKVVWVQDGAAAYEQALEGSYDILILDWMMPREDGVSVCRRLREDGYSGAILMLTARDAVEDRVDGLDAGADDYLVKPFAFAELSARMRAMYRRGTVPLVDDTMTIGGFTLDRNRRVVTCGGEAITLTTREFQLLDLLMQNRGQVMTRELLMDRVWGVGADVTDNALDAYVRLLRKKLESVEGEMRIRTVRGLGYCLEA